MIRYHNSILTDTGILSVDNIVIDFWLTESNHRDLIETEINSLLLEGVRVISWNSNKPGTFCKQFSFKLGEETSFWLGHGLISNGIANERFRLDFNPNKVADHEVFKAIHAILVRCSKSVVPRIARFDLAIDIPVDRSRCFLVKDRRLYIERKHGVEFTQYLGSKSASVGRVKLYNKTAEAKLDYPLTRLELTLDPKTPYEEIKFPKVYYLKSKTADNIEEKITDTERFILNAVLQGFGALTDLGRKTRAKIENLMQNRVLQISISSENYEKILQEAQNHIKIKEN